MFSDTAVVCKTEDKSSKEELKYLVSHRFLAIYLFSRLFNLVDPGQRFAITEKELPAQTQVNIPQAAPQQNPLEKIPDFDGVGRLTPVVSRKSGAPQYALTDVKGNVLMFVSPALGVDLQPHLGKIVGVSGSRGYMPRLKKNHVSVSQVERLAPTALLASLPGEKPNRR